jgi:hypothetical protein
MADGAKAPATEQAAEIKIESLTLRQRLAYIRDHSSGVGKEDIKMQYERDGKSKEITIQGHTIGGVLAGIRPLLKDYRILVVPNLVERTYNGNRCDVLVDFEWENLDHPEDRKTIRWAGSDTDKGGKGFAKAGTNALKEHLKKLFLITDKQDAAEETEQVEHQTDEGLKRGDIENVKERAGRTRERWAANFKASVEAAKTEKDIDRLFRENSDELADLPQVTREFFSELKITCKGRLSVPPSSVDPRG